MPRYNPAIIEPKWQKIWDQLRPFKAPRLPPGPKLYVLDMFPYPSGDGLHVGHPEGYTATDIVCRYQRMRGKSVMHPMGWDAFGLPAEQHAKKTGTPPRTTTEKNIGTFRRQLKMLGFSYDWDRELATTDVAYFRWTQWIFLVLYDTWFDADRQQGRPMSELPIPPDIVAQGAGAIRLYQDERRLAYQLEAPVNWCPELGTVLANEEVIGGVSERGGDPVVRLPLRQWMLRITAYADRLERDLEPLDWSEGIKALQRNWIGRSTGAEVDFYVGDAAGAGLGNQPPGQPPSAYTAWAAGRKETGFPAKPGAETLRIYTTRPDTLFGATYMVVAPEHPAVRQLTTAVQQAAVEEYCQRAARKSDMDRTDLAKGKSGVFTGSFAVNPANGACVPVWVADYVLMGYGTGAIMAVPAHDTRDYEFARQYDLPIVEVVQAKTPQKDGVAFTGEGTAVNSGPYSGLSTAEFKSRIAADLAAAGVGRSAVNYKLRDWLFSRQHFWGEPFPLLHELDERGAPTGLVMPVPPNELPVDLPDMPHFKPHGGPEPPLEQAPAEWLYPVIDGRKYKRETNTMPQWAGSCWYYLRFLDPANAESFVDPEQLGINQLGAVYEGLMSYTGSIAGDHMVEVAKDGDPAKGSWVVPLSATEGFDDRWFVTTTDPQTGEVRRVTYSPGDFVFRLSGRDRQRSASYYTPEVLTRCVVTHSLAELLTSDTTAADVLGLSVCEPALGSGAFLVEAINQLAGEYLTRRQAELGTRIDPEQYPAELQKVKAYLALHNCYGVDLNATAVELAEITLWLDAMHPGLRAPWFGLHLRRGNSLIGARRETWTPAQVAKRGWLTTVPTARPLGTGVSPYEVHHFLLPPAGWGAVADTKEAKEGRPKATAELKTWRRGVMSVLGKTELTRVQGLAQRVEALWALAQRRLEVAEAEIRRAIPIWGATGLPVGTGAVQREQIEASLLDANSAYRRLRRVMDAWAALWFWPVTTSVTPPTREQWIAALEALLGTVSKTEAKRGRGMWGVETTWAELDDAEHNEVVFGQMKPVPDVLAEHPWLGVCERIAEREGFFHWELDFAPVFARGGFDLQVGNPPWVRPDWDDSLVLAEDDAWFGLAEKPKVEAVRERREQMLDEGDVRYLDERASLAGTSAHLGSNVDRPLLFGTQPDLYRCFMDRTWRSMDVNGVVGLLHPESHFTETRAAGLRREAYQRLRRLWQFKNELQLFEVGNQVVFGVNVYAKPEDIDFGYMASIFSPDTIDRSLAHDGSGPLPGMKDDADRWDIRPHLGRLIIADKRVLATWAALIDEPRTPATEARMLRPINTSNQRVLERLAVAPRFGAIHYEWTRGWEEDVHRKAGYFVGRSAVPELLEDVILQGPHFSVATPYAKQPNVTMRSNKDYQVWDLEELADLAAPRTSYQRARSLPDYLAGYPRWNGESANQFWRLVWRNMTVSGNERSLFAAIFPPGPTHVHAVHSLATPDLRDLGIAAGMWASLVVDFFVKVSGVSKVQAELAARFPHPRSHPLVPELILRALRLNCLTADYAPFWEELFDPSWQLDRWTRDLPAVPMGEVEKTWTMATPLRRDAERRQALVEIDALAAVMLGITAEELCAIYRTQFGVLRKYERVMQHDANGRQVSKDVLKEYEKYGPRAELGRYELPFTPVDRETEMTVAHEEFNRRLATRPEGAARPA